MVRSTKKYLYGVTLIYISSISSLVATEEIKGQAYLHSFKTDSFGVVHSHFKESVSELT